MIVNLFGGPGAGKSTCAAYIFSQLKFKNVLCELVTEFAKDLTWDKTEAINDQLYVLGNQYHQIKRVYDKVDFVILDSPIILSILYNRRNKSFSTHHFEDFILYLHNSFISANYFIERKKPYWQIGRNESENDAKNIDDEIKNLLTSNNIRYRIISGNESGCQDIINELIGESYDILQ